jgi:nucleoside-diphosphate-sugar epimerase
MLEPGSLRRAMAGCDVVFHCASGPATEGGYARTNVDGTRNLLDACREAGVQRLVYLSSIAVHGPNPPDPVTEDSPYQLCDRDYSDSKIRTEQLLFDCYREHGVPVVILRPTFIWGPRSSLFTMRQLPAMKAGRFVLVDQGRGRCSAVYVDNLIDAMLLAACRVEAVGQAFLITDGQDDVTWAEFFGHYAQWLGIAELPSISSRSLLSRAVAAQIEPCQAWLNRLAGSPAPLPRRVLRRALREWLSLCGRFGYQSAWDTAKYARRGRVDITKARTLLGYQPRYTLESGMAETYRWVCDQMGFQLDLPGWDRL